MAIYNQSWLHTILNDLNGANVNANIWQSICLHYGITETINGNWLEALCSFFDVNHEIGEAWLQSLAEDFGATEPVNGSWIQALALEIEKNANLIDALLTRVNSEGGVFEAETCLEEQLNALEI